MLNAQYKVEHWGREGAALTSASWNNIWHKWRHENQIDITIKELKNKWNYLKETYSTWLNLKQLAWDGYDEVIDTFNLTEDRWTEVLQVALKAKRFRVMRLPHKEKVV
ncbi:hypothetical protein GIB67_005723 [Kingdonia uniflora]|uniref:Myb/SANT-like domain-containing protein n=1 Tax=Kingdonia uniflora TaxID=39325 RepID=A0A7J7KVF0_9MAGN|nr:hypothetical protein GIB67_005723 [Kingdonia uniflora]